MMQSCLRRRWLMPGIVIAAMFVQSEVQTGHAQEAGRWRTPSTRWLDEQPREVNRRPTIPEYLEEMAWKTLDQEVLLIAGSATAWRWNDQKWFSDFRTANRGFGGSRIDDNAYFAEQLLVPFRPSTIVLYAGDNDLWQGKPPNVTAEHFGDFVAAVHRELPDTQVVFVSIRPSIARWEIWESMQETNALIKQQIDTDPNLYYADITAVTLGDDGRPRREFFIDDDLHLTERGYFAWSRIVKPIVRRAEARYRQLKDCDLCGSQR